MDYLEFLGRVHEALAPPTYLEIGIRYGHSLALSSSPSIGVDPAYELRVKAPDDAELHRETSDEFFARPDPLARFGRKPAALSFIDGMHLSEYALRDFINVERHSHWAGVIVFDDMLPREVDEAARDRTTHAWTGDVYKMVEILGRNRADLTCLRIDVEPTGVMVVVGLDPESGVLADRYEKLEAAAKTPDPQDVPKSLLDRSDALDPEQVLGASFWDVLRRGQAGEIDEKEGRRALGKALRADFGRAVSRRRLRDVLPLPS